MKWGDVRAHQGRVSHQPLANAAQSYHRWVHDAIRDNVPLVNLPASCCRQRQQFLKNRR